MSPFKFNPAESRIIVTLARVARLRTNYIRLKIDRLQCRRHTWRIIVIFVSSRRINDSCHKQTRVSAKSSDTIAVSGEQSATISRLKRARPSACLTSERHPITAAAARCLVIVVETCHLTRDGTDRARDRALLETAFSILPVQADGECRKSVIQLPILDQAATLKAQVG